LVAVSKTNEARKSILMPEAIKTYSNVNRSDSSVHFVISRMEDVHDKHGGEDFNVTVESSDDSFRDVKVEVNIMVNSIDTMNSDRDAHLKSDDFFNAENHEAIRFVSSSYESGKLKGHLTIRDITKEVELDAEYLGTAVDPYGQTKAGFSISGKISRSEFGLKWNAITEAGSIVVSDDVKLEIDAQFIQQ